MNSSRIALRSTTAVNSMLATIAGSIAITSHRVTASIDCVASVGRTASTSATPACDSTAVMAAAANRSRQLAFIKRHASVKHSMTGTFPAVSGLIVSGMQPS